MCFTTFLHVFTMFYNFKNNNINKIPWEFYEIILTSTLINIFLKHVIIMKYLQIMKTAILNDWNKG